MAFFSSGFNPGIQWISKPSPAALSSSTTASLSNDISPVQVIPTIQSASVLASPSILQTFASSLTLQTSTPAEVSSTKFLGTSSTAAVTTLNQSLSLTTSDGTITSESVTLRISTTATSASASTSTSIPVTVSSTPKAATRARFQMPVIFGGVAGLIVLILVVAVLWYRRRKRLRDAKHVLHPFRVEVDSEPLDSTPAVMIPPESSIATTPPVRKGTNSSNQDPLSAPGNNVSHSWRSRGDTETSHASPGPSTLELLMENHLLRSEVEELQRMLEIPSPPYSASTSIAQIYRA